MELGREMKRLYEQDIPGLTFAPVVMVGTASCSQCICHSVAEGLLVLLTLSSNIGIGVDLVVNKCGVERLDY